MRVSTLAGGTYGSTDGIGSLAKFLTPFGVAIDPMGKYALVSTFFTIRRIDLATALVSTLAGNSTMGSTDGIGSMAQFQVAMHVAIDPTGKYALVVDSMNHRIRRIDLATALVSTLAGSSTRGSTDGIGSMAQFDDPKRIAIDPKGAYALVVDKSSIRRLDLATALVSTLAAISSPWPNGVAIDPTGAYALITAEYRIFRINMTTSLVSTLAGGSWQPNPVSVDGNGTLARFRYAGDVVIDPTGSYALVVDSPLIRRIGMSTSSVSTLAGNSTSGNADGIASQVQLNAMSGIVIDPTGVYALVAIGSNDHRISRIALSEPCKAGNYCPGAGLAMACAMGEFCPAGSSVASPCTAGSYCNSTDLSAVSGPCLAGYWCAGGSSSSMQNGCAAGSYCPAGSSSPLLCPIGAYCATALRGDVHWCPSGTYCRSAGLTAPVNLTCLEGFVQCVTNVSLLVFICRSCV